VGGISGLVLSIILGIVAFVHHALTLKDAEKFIADATAAGIKFKPEDVPNDTGIFYFSLAFAAIHIIIFGAKMAKKK
jgi:APA family basic amino acid/polyamine antiporter